MTTISFYHTTILFFYFMFQVSNSYNTTTSKLIGFSSYLIDRDSLESKSFNQYVNKTDILARSKSRLSYLKSILKLPNNHAVDTTNIESTSVMAISTTYVMEIYVGTPPAKQMVLLDTGSDVSWIQCLPCANCFAQNLPIFNPGQSSSYQVLGRESSECENLENKRIHIQYYEKCEYGLSYDDDSYTYGELALETYTVGGISIPNMVHGCGHNNVGVFDEKSTGMIGLGDGPISFFGQIKHYIGGMFSYCLVSKFGSNPNARSKISFGNNAVVNGRGVMSTPLFQRRGSTQYFLTLESISVGNTRIRMRRQSGNIMIDTGTTLTFLPSNVILDLMDALRDEIHNRPFNYQNALCYPSNTDIPTITFHFADGANIALSKERTFVIDEDDELCLNMKSDDDLSVFGNLSQMDFLIGYNIPNKRVYFKQTDCSRHT